MPLTSIQNWTRTHGLTRPTGAPKRISDEVKAEALRLYKEGVSCHATAEQLKISEWTVAEVVKAAGLTVLRLRPEAQRLIFWSHVIKGPNCWAWDGMKDDHGYGKMRWGKRETKAHRVSFEIHFGPIPKGLIVIHACDNPECCNPEHLRAATHQENITDMIQKGRAYWQKKGKPK